MAINKFTVSLTFGEVERVVSELRKHRDNNSHYLQSSEDGYVVSRRYDADTKEYVDIEPHVISYMVTGGEEYVETFNKVSEVISWFTGERETLDPTKVAILKAARKRLDAEQAAAKEAADAS